MNRVVTAMFTGGMLMLISCGVTPAAPNSPVVEPTSPLTPLAPDTAVTPKSNGTHTPLPSTLEIDEGNNPILEESLTMTSTTPESPDLLNLPQVEQAKEDLATRLEITSTQIEVIDIQPKTWSDSSMGCPQPGMAYLQVPEDGLLIRLRVDNQTYDYHSGGTREPFLCEQPIQIRKSTPVFGEDILTRPSQGDD